MTAHEPPRDILDTCRRLLAEQADKCHWHGGPDPCPACDSTTTHRQKPVDQPTQLRLVHNREQQP